MTTIESKVDLVEAGAALKDLAANPNCREAFTASPLLSDFLRPAAYRYVVGSDRPALFERLNALAGKGYRVGAEYVGEEATDAREIDAVCEEYLQLIAEIDAERPVQLGFDLSNVGLLVSEELAIRNTAHLLEAARTKGIDILISMERSPFVDQIISVFGKLADDHDNVGLTVQAHLHRTLDDVHEIAARGRKVRLVKGVYRERADIALPRGPELVERYLQIAERLLDDGVVLACGTHDAAVLRGLGDRGLLSRIAEIEMLHGVRPGLLRQYRERGLPCRVSAVYGTNWWLHFLHRLAEHPTNVLTALADLSDRERPSAGQDY